MNMIDLLLKASLLIKKLTNVDGNTLIFKILTP